MMVVLVFVLAFSSRKPAQASPAIPGDFLVIDSAAGTGGKGALFTVDPVTGSRTILSDFGNAIQGPTGGFLFGIAIQPSGTILVIDLLAGTGGHGALFTVHPVTGSRTILSDFGNAIQGPTGVALSGIAIEPSGRILVTDVGNIGPGGSLFTVDPVTGSRTILSDFGNATQGPLGVYPSGIAIGASGTILVIDYNAGTGGKGALFTVHPVTGSRTILSDFGNATQGPTGLDAFGIAIEPSGTILVIDAAAATGGKGALFTVDPVTGSRTVLSDFGNASQGPLGDEPFGIAIDPSGTILIIDRFARALFTVDPVTGSRTILSDFGNAVQGPTGANPDGIAIFSSVTVPSDTVPPDTTITSVVDGKGKPVANGDKTASTSIKLTFTGSDNVAVSDFQCSLDGAAFSPCSSPTSFINLTGSTHVFQVRAVDTSGLVDPTPATWSWFVSGNHFK